MIRATLRFFGSDGACKSQREVMLPAIPRVGEDFFCGVEEGGRPRGFGVLDVLWRVDENNEASVDIALTRGEANPNRREGLAAELIAETEAKLKREAPELRQRIERVNDYMKSVVTPNQHTLSIIKRLLDGAKH